MKKTLSLALVSALMLSLSVLARVEYDSTGRYIIKDTTIRGQKRAEQLQNQQERKIQAAAAARIDYEKALRDLNSSSARGYQTNNKARGYNVR